MGNEATGWLAKGEIVRVMIGGIAAVSLLEVGYLRGRMNDRLTEEA